MGYSIWQSPGDAAATNGQRGLHEQYGKRIMPITLTVVKQQKATTANGKKHQMAKAKAGDHSHQTTELVHVAENAGT